MFQKDLTDERSSLNVIVSFPGLEPQIRKGEKVVGIRICLWS